MINISEYLYKTRLMKLPFLILAVCLALIAGVTGCGGDDATSSETQGSGSATTTDDSANTTDGGGDSEPEASDSGDNPIVGDYEAEGPFAAISGGEGNKKPTFEPSGEPTPKEVVSRELEVGSGPAAKLGDEVRVYFAGAAYETGEVQFSGWPPAEPGVVELGSGAYGKNWEKTVVGMKAGGIRQVILPSSEFAQGKPVEYVIVMADLKPKSG